MPIVETSTQDVSNLVSIIGEGRKVDAHAASGFQFIGNVDNPFWDFSGYSGKEVYFVYDPEFDWDGREGQEILRRFYDDVANPDSEFPPEIQIGGRASMILGSNVLPQNSSDTMHTVASITKTTTRASQQEIAAALAADPLLILDFFRYNALTNGEEVHYSVATVSDEALTVEDGGIYCMDDLKEHHKHMNIAYYCLAMCYEKALAVKVLLARQVSEIEDINRRIKTNNDFLNAANKLYQGYYDKCSQSSNTTGAVVNTTADAYKVNGTTLPSYVNSTGGGSLTNGGMDATWTDSEGGTSANGDYSNIDTKEQGNLTMISNAQETIRMYGDELSTDAQVLNTKLTQIMQNYNSFLSIATQLAKSTGEYFKSIASNVR